MKRKPMQLLLQVVVLLTYILSAFWVYVHPPPLCSLFVHSYPALLSLRLISLICVSFLTRSLQGARIRYKRRVTLPSPVRGLCAGRDSWGRALVLAAMRDGFGYVSQKGVVEQIVRTQYAVSATTFPAQGAMR